MPHRKKQSGGQATATARQRAFAERRRKAGLVRVWAPVAMVPEIERAVQEALKKQLDV